MRSSKPSLAAAKIHEFATLQAPSPMNVTVLPAIGPRFSWNVKMSVRIWQGCSSSVSALMVGTPENLGELLDVALCERADDRAVNHAAQHAGGVLDRLAAAQLNVIGIEKHRLPAQFADADLKRNPRARGRFGKDQRPGLAGQRLGFMLAALAFEPDGVAQNFYQNPPAATFPMTIDVSSFRFWGFAQRKLINPSPAWTSLLLRGMASVGRALGGAARPRRYSAAKTSQASPSLQNFSPHPPPARDTRPPWCDADASVRQTPAVPSPSACRAFCRHGENRCARRNHPPAGHRDGPAGKSAAFPPSNGPRRGPPSAVRLFRRRTISQSAATPAQLPASVFAAMSRMEAIFAKENPQARNWASVTAARSSGRGNRRSGKHFFEAGEDVVRRRAVELLMRHRLHERLERRPPGFRRQLARPDIRG